VEEEKEQMTISDIKKAYIRMREIDSTIPDDVLDFHSIVRRETPTACGSTKANCFC